MFLTTEQYAERLEKAQKTCETINYFIEKADEFHTKFKLEVDTSKFTNLDEKETALFFSLRDSFVHEEISETLRAFSRGDEGKVLDGVVDTIYFIAGTFALLKDGPITINHLSPAIVDKAATNNTSLNHIIDSKWGVLHSSIDLNLVYLLVSWLENQGVNPIEAFDEVHNSNMSKLDDNGEPIFDESNKIMKGPNFFEPDLSKFKLIDMYSNLTTN